MTHGALKGLHIVGAVLVGAGLIGVWLSDLQGRKVQDLARFSRVIRNIGFFYNGLVFPGAIVLLLSGTRMIVTTFGGRSFYSLHIPWLAGMVVRFTFEFIEGNTVTRFYFVRLRRLTQEALEENRFTKELVDAREAKTPRLTHFLDIPVFLVILALAFTKPMTWTPFFSLSATAIAVASMLTVAVPRRSAWQSKTRIGAR